MNRVSFPDGSEVFYELTRKPVRNINLRVKEDGTLRISANSRVSVKRIEDFIIAEQEFIRRAVERLEKRRSESEISYDRLRWLGEEYPVRVISSSRECAVLEQQEIRVFTRHDEPEHVRLLLRGFLAESFTQLCRELNDEVRSALISRGVTPPPTRVTIKEMKSRWGSCTWGKGHISINFRLAAYPRETVLSVFWHEYAHYWHHDHSERFYAFLEQHYPEYRKWNSLLK
ncbi:MAG: M48 family metallopeptidase [Oscillospiraceae bacterium]